MLPDGWSVQWGLRRGTQLSTIYTIFEFFFSFSEHFRRFLFEMLLALQNINTFYQIPILVLPNVIEKEVEFRPLAWSKKTIVKINELNNLYKLNN